MFRFLGSIENTQKGNSQLIYTSADHFINLLGSGFDIHKLRSPNFRLGLTVLTNYLDYFLFDI